MTYPQYGNGVRLEGERLILSKIGTTAFPGAILGAWLITALPELLRFLKDWRTVFNGLVLVGVILFLPNGLLTLGTLLPRRVARPRPGRLWTPMAEHSRRARPPCRGLRRGGPLRWLPPRPYQLRSHPRRRPSFGPGRCWRWTA